MSLEDVAQGKVWFIYHTENLCLFFSPTRVAQLKLVPPEQRQNVMFELCKRFDRPDRPEKTPVMSDLVMWDILRENGWAFRPRERRLSVYTELEDGSSASTE